MNKSRKKLIIISCAVLVLLGFGVSVMFFGMGGLAFMDRGDTEKVSKHVASSVSQLQLPSDFELVTKIKTGDTLNSAASQGWMYEYASPTPRQQTCKSLQQSLEAAGYDVTKADCPDDDIPEAYSLYGRSTGENIVISVSFVGHNGGDLQIAAKEIQSE